MTPEQTLVERATVPEFFAKVAAETGVTPTSVESARVLRVLGDRVAGGVDRYLEKVAAARQANHDNLIKAAGEAADLAAGIFPTPPAPSPTDPTKVAADLEAYEAALAVLKQASGTETLTPEIPGEDETDETKKKDPAVVGAAA